MGTAGYYLHLEPGGSFVGGGIWMPEAATLKSIRSEIYFNSTEFLSILNEKEFKKIYGPLDDFDKLKKAPKDFPADFADVELLKHLSYVVMQEVPTEKVFSTGFLDQVLRSFRVMKPLVDFLNRGIANM